MVIDFNDRGEPIGIEITAPEAITAEHVAQTLAELNLPPIDPAELAPLKA